MSFQREEYVRACWRRARVFRLLAAATAGLGGVFFAVLWWVERTSDSVVMDTSKPLAAAAAPIIRALAIDPLAAGIGSVTLFLVCVILLLSFRLPPESGVG